MNEEKIIGVIGGMGPYAGLDLTRKIFEETIAGTDQDHVPVAMLSLSPRIPDRTAFLLQEIDTNPAPAIAHVALQLERMGAMVAGMSCNSAHVPALFNEIHSMLQASESRIRLINMIDETVNYIVADHTHLSRIGVLSTNSVYHFGVYKKALSQAQLDPVLPDVATQENIIHRAIYDPAYGIKAQSDPVSEKAKQDIAGAIEKLNKAGAEAIILGCTELPLALPEPELNGIPLVDPTRILARALIRETYPEKLKSVK